MEAMYNIFISFLKSQNRENVVKVRFSESLNDRKNKRVKEKLDEKGMKINILHFKCVKLSY